MWFIQATVSRLRSLLPWLLRHGQHVHRLDMRLLASGPEAEQLLAGCMTACAAGGQLQQLVLESYTNGPLVVAGWASALTRLQQLYLVGATLQLTASLHPLTALRKLQLFSAGLELLPGVRLPPGLRELELSDPAAAGLPHQASAAHVWHRKPGSVHACCPATGIVWGGDCGAH